VAAAALVGCAASPLHYSAVLDQPDGLGPGDPVLHDGNNVGSVTSVSPGAGDAQVSVELDHRLSGSVRTDSILILRGAGTSPALELMTPGMAGAEASDGAQLYGASNEDEAQLLVNILGPMAMGNSYGQFLNRALPQASPSPGASVMQNQLLDILRQTLAAATAASGATPMGRIQAEQLRRDADAVARQLDAHGRGTEADQLREQVDRLTGAAGVPPNTLTVPRATPTP
jgi:hypothetical protein